MNLFIQSVDRVVPYSFSLGSDTKSSRYTQSNENSLQRLTNRETRDYVQNVQRNSKNIPDFSNVCGRVKVGEDADDSGESIGQFRVISGQRTKRGHHPWQATVRARGRNGRSTHWCGAVIISKTHILTGKVKNSILFFIWGNFGDGQGLIPAMCSKFVKFLIDLRQIFYQFLIIKKTFSMGCR